MIRDEAIKIIDNFFYCVVFPRCNGKLYSHSRLDEAVKMAIEALSQPEIIRCKECGYYEDGHCDMHHMGVDPDDYCSYAVGR